MRPSSKRAADATVLLDRADRHARRLADLVVHLHALRGRAGRGFRLRVGRQRQGGDDSGIIHEAVVRMEHRAGQAGRAAARQFRGQRHAEEGLPPLVQRLGDVERVIAVGALDMGRDPVAEGGDAVGRRTHLHMLVFRALPVGRPRLRAAHHDDGFRAGQVIRRPLALGRGGERPGIGDAHHQRAALQGEGAQVFLDVAVGSGGGRRVCHGLTSACVPGARSGTRACIRNTGPRFPCRS